MLKMNITIITWPFFQCFEVPKSTSKDGWLVLGRAEDIRTTCLDASHGNSHVFHGTWISLTIWKWWFSICQTVRSPEASRGYGNSMKSLSWKKDDLEERSPYVRTSGLKEAGCHCVAHGTSKQCVDYSNESVSFSVTFEWAMNNSVLWHWDRFGIVNHWCFQDFQGDKLTKVQLDSLDSNKEVLMFQSFPVTWKLQGFGSSSTEIPIGDFRGWIVSRWENHQQSAQRRCGRSRSGPSPLPRLASQDLTIRRFDLPSGKLT